MNTWQLKPDEYFFRDDDDGAWAYQRQLEEQEQENS
jgi:hypothetical protein